MATIASGMITLNSVNDAYSVSLSPSSCVINAKWNGDDPDYTNAFSDITVYRGDDKVAYTYSVESYTGTNFPPLIEQIDQYTTRFKISGIASGALSGSIKIKIQVGTEYTTTATLAFTVVRETSMLDWILDWENREKTEIAGEHIITPKIFVGKSENGGLLTGTYIGPAFDNSGRTGVFGYSKGREIFHLDNTGGVIGGWEIQDGGIQTSDGTLKILSEGTIISSPNGMTAWELNKNGTATFAGGDIVLKKGLSCFKGEIQADKGKIGNWNIGQHSLFNQAILIDSDSKFIGIRRTAGVISPDEPTKNDFYSSLKSIGGVAIFSENSANFGVECWVPGDSTNPENPNAIGRLVFSLGTVNKIAGWNFDYNAIWRGVKNNTAKQYTTASGDVTIGTSGLRGLNWFIDSDGEISFVGGLLHFDSNGGTIGGWTLNPNCFVTSSAALVSMNGYTGLYLSNVGEFEGIACTAYESTIKNKGGIYMRTNSVQTLLAAYNQKSLTFQLSSNGLSKIAGWWFDEKHLFTGLKYASAFEYDGDGNITISIEGVRGSKWRLEADGSGAIAGGKISWKSNGDVVFDPSVTLSWSNISNALGDNFTQISGDTIYTGSINADNINSGTISTELIDADELLSVDGKWALLRDGSGYLASKGILWGPDGDLEVNGKITSSSGIIGGFTIDSNGIFSQAKSYTGEVKNGAFSLYSKGEAFLCFRDEGRWAGIGINVMVGTADKAVARFESTYVDRTWSSWNTNIALVLHAENASRNFAYIGSGNGVLNGWIEGYRFERLMLTQEATITNSGIDLRKTNKWILKSTAKSADVILPTASEVRNALGINTNLTIPFCVELTIISDIGSKHISLFGRTSRTDGAGNRPWQSNDYPVFINIDGSSMEQIELDEGGCCRLWLIYDPSETQTVNDFDCKYSARLLNKSI